MDNLKDQIDSRGREQVEVQAHIPVLRTSSDPSSTSNIIIHTTRNSEETHEEGLTGPNSVLRLEAIPILPSKPLHRDQQQEEEAIRDDQDHDIAGDGSLASTSHLSMLNTFFQAKSNYLDSIIEDWKNLLATTTSPSSYVSNEKNISESSLQAMISEEQQQDTLPESSEEKRSPSSKSNSKEHKQTMTPLYYSPDHKEVYRPSLDDKIVGTSDDDLFAMSLRDNDNLELTPTTNTDTVDESEKEDDEEGYYEEDIDQNATVIVTPSSTSYAQENENMEQVNSIIKETFTPYYGGSILSSTPDGSTSDRNVSSTLSASSTARILDFEKLNGSEISLSSPHFSSVNTPIHERNTSTSEHAQQDASNGTIVLNTFISPQSLPLKVLAQMNKESVTIPSERQPATQTDIHLEEAEPGMDFSQQNNVESSYIGDFESPPQSSTYSKSSIASPTLVSEEEIRNSLLAEEERLEFRPQHKFLNDEKENVLDQQDSNVSSNRDKELIETYSRMNSLVEQNEELVQQLSAVLKRNEELRKALLLSETKRNRLSEINKDLTQQVSLSKTKDEELVSHANSPQLESETLLKQTLDEREKLISELQDEIRITKQENSQLQKLLDPSLYESNNQSQIEQLKTEIRSLQDVIESLNVKFKDSRRKDEETNKRREIELRKEYTVKLSQIEKERHDMEEENVLLKLKIKELEEQVLIAGNKDQEHLSCALEKEEEYVRKITFLKQEHLLQIQELQRSSRVNELSLRKIIDEKELTIQQLQETLGSAISKAPSSSENTVESMIASHHQQIDKLSQEVEAKNETIQKQNNQLENVTMELELLKQRSSTLSGLVVKYERKIHDLELSNMFFEGEMKRLQLANTHLQQDISTAAHENESLQKVYEEHFNSIQATSRDHEQTISKLQEEKLQVSKKMSILEEELNVLRSKYENLKSLFEKREKSFAVQRENYESQISSMKQHHEKALKELREKCSNLLESKTEKMTNLEQSHMKIEKQDQIMKKLLKDKLIDSFHLQEDFKSIRKQFDSMQGNVACLTSEIENVSLESESVKQLLQKEIEHLQERNMACVQVNERLIDLVRRKEADIEEYQLKESKMKEELKRLKATTDNQIQMLNKQNETMRSELLHTSLELSKEKSQLAYVEKVEHAMRSNVASLSESNDKLMDQVHQLQTENEKLFASLNHLKSQHENDFKKLEEQVERARVELEESRKLLKDSTSKEKQLQNELKECKDELQRVKIQNSTLEKERNAQRQEHKRMEELWSSKLSQVSAHLVSIEEITKRQEEKIESEQQDFMKRLQEKDNSIDQLEKEIQTLKKKSAAITSSMEMTLSEELRLHNHRLEMKINTLEKDLASFVNEATESAKQMRVLKEEKATLNAVLSQVKIQLATCQSDKEGMRLALTKRIDEYEKTIKELHDQLAINIEYLHSSKSALQEIQNQNSLIVELRKQIEEKSIEIAKLEHHNVFIERKYEEQVKSLEKKFIEITHELVELKTQNHEKVLQRVLSKSETSSILNFPKVVPVADDLQSLQQALYQAQIKLKQAEALGHDLEVSQNENQHLAKLYAKEKNKVLVLEKEVEKLKHCVPENKEQV